MGHRDTCAAQPADRIVAGPAWPKFWCWLGLLVALSTLTDLFFFTGFYCSDDLEYLSGARLIMERSSLGSSPTLGQKRLTLVLWNLLVASLLGYRVQVIAASYVLFHQLAVVLTGLLARRLFDRTVGLVAACTVAFFPALTVFSSQILPDIPLACYVLLSLMGFLWGCDLRRAGRRTLAWLAMFGAGAAAGLAYLTKESGLLLVPFFFVLWLLVEVRAERRKALVTGSGFAVGLLVTLVGEFALLSVLTGRPFFRLGWTMGTSEITPWIVRKVESRLAPSARWRWMMQETDPTLYPTVLKLGFAGSLLIYPFLRGRWRLTVFGLALWLFAYTTWGTMNFSRYLPPTIQARYYIPVVPLAAIMYAAVLVWLLRLLARVVPVRWRAGPARVLGTVAVLLPLLPGLRGMDLFAGNSYWSHAVANVNQAVAAAYHESSRPVFASWALESRLDEMLHGQPRPYLHRASTVTEEALDSLLARGGFYYLEFDRVAPFVKDQALLTAPARCLLDRLVHAAAWHNVTDGRIAVRRIASFDTWCSRWDWLRFQWFPSLDPTDSPAVWRPIEPELHEIVVGAAQRFQPNSRGTIELYEVLPATAVGSTAVLAGYQHAFELRDLGPQSTGTGRANRLEGWKLAQPADLIVRRDRKGHALLTLDLPEGQEVCLVSDESAAESIWTLEPASVHAICIGVWLDQSCRVEAGARIISESGQAEPVGRCLLERDGAHAFLLRTDAESIRFQLRLTLRGRGQCRALVYRLSTPAPNAAALELIELGSHLERVEEWPFYVKQTASGPTVWGWRIPDEGITLEEVDGLPRLAFHVSRRSKPLFVWLEKSAARRYLACPPHGRLLVGLHYSSDGDAKGALRGLLYPDSSLNGEPISEARFPVGQEQMAWFLVKAGAQPLYLRPTFMVQGEGGISMQRMIVLCARPDVLVCPADELPSSQPASMPDSNGQGGPDVTEPGR